MTPRTRWSAALLACLAGVAAAELVIDGDIGRSKLIPKEGDEITFLVPVKNAGAEAFAGPCVIRWSARPRGEAAVQPIEMREEIELPAGETTDIAIAWRVPRNGWYRLSFDLADPAPAEPAARRAIVSVPVVVRDLYFAWFGSPLSFRWCNVPTTVKDDDERAAWLRRGAYPCAWKGGVCYKDNTVEKWLEQYGASRWIAIDEIGGLDEHSERMYAALRKLKAEDPDRFHAIWYMGAHEYWRDVRDIVDLYMPERYLNYLGNQLGIFDPAVRTAREAGVMDRMIIALGINQIKDKETEEVRVSPTRDDVLRQVRYLKRIAPDMPGLACFTSGSAAPGVAEYGDQLCRKYFIEPVVTMADRWLASVERRGPAEYAVEAELTNVGGMDARDVKVVFECAGVRFAQAIVEELKVGETRRVQATCSVPGVTGRVTAAVAPARQYTVLDPECWDVLTGEEAEAGMQAVFLPFAEAPRVRVPVRWSPPAGAIVPEAAQSGDAATPVTRVAPLPGEADAEAVASWVPPTDVAPGDTAMFTLSDEADLKSRAWRTFERDGDRLHLTNASYAAELDLATDQLISLIPAGSETSIWSKPWRFDCPGHGGFGEATVDRQPAAVVVTVPFESDLARGQSRYVFYLQSPFIEIARYFEPKQPLTIRNAADRCNLPQRGGTFALQRGVGGLVERGKLIDGTDYRDLLFGYGGERPGPSNATKAGWIDISFAEEHNAGLGVAICQRWRDAHSKVYDVTRLYDANDWLEVLYVWGEEWTVERPQFSRLWLVPHGHLDFTDPSVVPPAQQVWETEHNPLRPVRP